MAEVIGRVIATEKVPTTIDSFYFWTQPETILHPFDVVKVEDVYNTTGRFLYLVGIDADEETSYWLQIAFDSSELRWDKYMNRVQNG